MPVTYTATIWTDGEGSTSDEKGIETMARTWRIVVAGGLPTFAGLLDSAGVERFNQHPQRTDLIARGHSLKPFGGDPTTWELTWTYSNAPLELTGDVPSAASSGQPPNKNQTASGNATARLPTITFSRREVMEVADADFLGLSIVNTAGEPFDPPIEVPRSRLSISINYKSVLIDVPHILEYWDAVNVSAWKGFPQKTLKVADFSVKTVYETHTLEGATTPTILAMTDVTVNVDYKADTWVLKVLNRGRREKKTSYIRNEVGSITGTETILVAITDATGQPIQEPVPLKADGTRATTTAEFHYLEFDVFDLKEFSNLLK